MVFAQYADNSSRPFKKLFGPLRAGFFKNSRRKEGRKGKKI